MTENKYYRNKLTTEINVEEIVTVVYLSFATDFPITGERHDFWELVFIDNGNILVKNDDDLHSMKQGQMILHKPNAFHGSSTNEKFSNMIVVSFVCKEIEKYNIHNKVFTLTSKEKALLEEIISESSVIFNEPITITNINKYTLKKDLPFAALQIIKSNIEKLMIYLIRRDMQNNLSAKDEKNINNKQEICDKIIKYLMENVYSKLSLKDVANHCGYSTVYIKQIFKDIIGCGVIHYHMMLKIDEAKKMIASGSYTMQQISDALEFSNAQYFSSFFKKITKMTPTAYLNSVKITKSLNIIPHFSRRS